MNVVRKSFFFNNLQNWANCARTRYSPANNIKLPGLCCHSQHIFRNIKSKQMSNKYYSGLQCGRSCVDIRIKLSRPLSRSVCRDKPTDHLNPNNNSNNTIIYVYVLDKDHMYITYTRNRIASHI